MKNTAKQGGGKAARRAQALDAKDRESQRGPGRPETVYSGKRDVHSSGRPSGNSRAAALRRLRKDRPDLHARILAGEISAHAAMVEAGFRHQTKGHPVANQFGCA
jgi:hypothetical protein